jgi:hypothetical protein
MSPLHLTDNPIVATSPDYFNSFFVVFINPHYFRVKSAPSRGREGLIGIDQDIAAQAKFATSESR